MADYITDRNSYGSLIRPDTKLHRKWFNEMVKLIGVQVLYMEPLKNKTYNLHGELTSDYKCPIKVGCIFEEHITQKTAKKLGWDSELIESAALIHVPYDLDGLQIGALFRVPSAFDYTKSRLFRVVRMSAAMIYPASITCEIVPEYEDTEARANEEQFKHTDFNVLNDEDNLWGGIQ